MLEMLGVLAIIGVLSVGGIAGYSKAMWMYKSNKQTEQFGTILRALIYNRDQFKVNDGSEDIFYIVPLLKAMGEIPDEMNVSGNVNVVRDAFGLHYTIYHHSTNYVGISTSTTNSDDSINICKNMYTIAQRFSSDIYLMEIQQGPLYTSHVYGDKYCTLGRRCLKDLKPSDLQELCNVCDEDNTCILYFVLWYY